MNSWRSKSRFALWLLALLLFVVPVWADESDEKAPPEDKQEIEIWRGDRVSVLTGDIVVPRGTILRGNIVCIGSDAVIEGEVTGGVVVVMGELRAPGRIGRDIVGVLSKLDLSDGTVDLGLVNVLGSLERSGASIRGEIVNISMGNWFPGVVPIFNWLKTVKLLLAFFTLIIVVALVPERVRLMADDVPVRYVSAFLMGLLGYILVVVIVWPIALTVIGLPLYWLFKALKWLGIAAIFYAIGRRLGRGFGREMSLLGAILLVFAIYAAATLVPGAFGMFGLLLRAVVETLFWLLFCVPAVGLILLTRAGTRGSGTPAAPVTRSPYPPPPGPEPFDPAPPPDTPPRGEGMAIGPAGGSEESDPTEGRPED